MSQTEAGVMVGVSERQIKLLLKAFRKKGTAGLIFTHG